MFRISATKKWYLFREQVFWCLFFYFARQQKLIQLCKKSLEQIVTQDKWKMSIKSMVWTTSQSENQLTNACTCPNDCLMVHDQRIKPYIYWLLTMLTCSFHLCCHWRVSETFTLGNLKGPDKQMRMGQSHIFISRGANKYSKNINIEQTPF